MQQFPYSVQANMPTQAPKVTARSEQSANSPMHFSSRIHPQTTRWNEAGVRKDFVGRGDSFSRCEQSPTAGHPVAITMCRSCTLSVYHNHSFYARNCGMSSMTSRRNLKILRA